MKSAQYIRRVNNIIIIVSRLDRIKMRTERCRLLVEENKIISRYNNRKMSQIE